MHLSIVYMCVLSCAIIWRTKVSPFENLVPEDAATQKGITNLFPFEYLLPNHPINIEIK